MGLRGGLLLLIVLLVGGALGSCPYLPPPGEDGTRTATVVVSPSPVLPSPLPTALPSALPTVPSDRFPEPIPPGRHPTPIQVTVTAVVTVQSGARARASNP